MTIDLDILSADMFGNLERDFEIISATSKQRDDGNYDVTFILAPREDACACPCHLRPAMEKAADCGPCKDCGH